MFSGQENWIRGNKNGANKGISEKPSENTQAARRVRFTGVREIVRLKSILKAYIRAAIAAEKAGLKVNFKKDPEPIPAELKKKLNEDSALKIAFAALTPGRQRAHILYFSAAKQSQTRETRIEKSRSQILEEAGLNDRWRRAWIAADESVPRILTPVAPLR